MSFPANHELFPCVYFAAYNYLPGCNLHDSLAPRISMSLLWLVRHRLLTNSMQDGEFHGHYTASLFGLPLLFSVHSTIFITNAFTKPAENYYIITNL